MDNEKKEFGKWWMWILGLVIVSSIIFTGLKYFGVIGQTIVERKVFEESYQRKAGLVQQIATYEAQIEELEVKLTNTKLNETDRVNINAQLAAIRIQLNAARKMQ